MGYALEMDGYFRTRVPMADGAGELPATYEVSAIPDDDDARPAVHFSFEVVEGIPRCREVHLARTEHGREVRRSDLEEIGLEAMLQSATLYMLRPIASRERDDQGRLRIRLSMENLDALRSNVAHVRRGSTGRGPSDDDLRHAAEIYQSAGRAPTKAVSEHFDIKHRTASLWIARAREKGFMS
jgi:hypothetical protein